MAIPIQFIPEIPESKLDADAQAKLNAGGTVNDKIFIPTLATDFTTPDVGNANKIWEVQTDIDLAGGSFSAPANITIYIKGGSVSNVGNFVGDNTSFKFINEDAVFDLFSATVSGTFLGNKYNISNFGGVADGSTDNKNVFEEILKIAKSSSGTVVVNKIDTAVYKMSATNFQTGVSPFYPNQISGAPYIDGCELHIEKGVTISKIADNLEKNFLFQIWNEGGKITGEGVIEGDRYTHDYQVTANLTTAITSGTFVNFRLLEISDEADLLVTKEINENITLSISNLATNQSEIINHINTDPDFSDYTATSIDATSFRINGQVGQYFKLILSAGDTDLNAPTEFYHNGNTHEDGVLIIRGSVSDHAVIEGVTLQNSTGEGYIASFQGNGDNAITAFTRANIDFDTGVITNDVGGSYMYADALRDITSYPHSWAYISHVSFSSMFSLYPSARVMFYDASNVFIESTSIVQLFRRINFKSTYKKARLVFDYTPNESSFSWYFDSKSVPLGGLIKNVKFYNNRRQHVSNPAPDDQFINCWFENVGGAAPNFDIDWEDHGKISTDGAVIGCTFINPAAGSLIMKGNESTKILNNTFDYTTNPNKSKVGMATSWSRKVSVRGNTFNGRINTYDIGNIISNNYTTNGGITIGAGGSRISEEILLNSNIRDQKDTGILTNAPAPSTSIISNSTFAYTRPWIETTGFPDIIREYGTIGWENITFAFNDKSAMHYTTGLTYPLFYLSSNTNLSHWYARNTIPDDGEHNGYYKDITITGLTPIDTDRHTAAAEFYAHGGIDGLKSSVNVSIRHGYPVDGVEYKDIKVKGWLNLGLDQYPNTDGVGDYDTVYVVNPNVEVPVEVDANEGYLNNTNYGGNEWTTAFRTPAKDVNIVVIGGIIRSLGDVTGYILKAEQYGTLEFIGTRFISDATTTETIDLTNTTFVPATTGNISFENCKFFGYSATPVTLRAGDTNI